MLKNSLRTSFYLAFLIILFWQCREYEFPSLAYPRVETRPVAEITSSGALFQGRIVTPGKKPVTDHGFIWSLHPNPHIYASERISLGAAGTSRSFEARIQHSLYADTTYYVKAFTSTDDHTVYGKVVSFRSAGGLPPVIDGLTPEAGTWGDTIRISGRYFSKVSAHVKVHFGSFASRVLESSDTSIHCIVPTEIADSAAAVTVTVSGQHAAWDRQFEFVTPVIDGFTPSEAAFGDILTISGSHFSSTPEQNKVYFNEYASQVIASSATSLHVVVPPTLNIRASRISVTVNLRKGESSQEFVLKAPVVSSFSPASGGRGTLVTITGENFAPHLAGNVVTFNGNEARIHAASATEITVFVPDGVYDDKTQVPLAVTVAGQRVISGQAFHLEEAWIQKNAIPGEALDFGVAFAIGNKGYAGLGSRDSQAFWQFSPEDNAWTQVAPFPGRARDHATAFVIDGKAYAGGGGRGPYLKDFWRFDPVADTWTQVADFPFGISDAVGLSANGKGYVLARNPVEDHHTLWEYDPVADQWSAVAANTPMENEVDAGFVVGGRLFYVTNDPSAYRNDLVEFDFGMLDWFVREDGGGDRQLAEYVTCFSAGAKGYIIDPSGMHEYDTQLDVWKKMQVAPPARQAAIAFVIGDKAYFGYGHAGKTRLRDFWEWDMAFE